MPRPPGEDRANSSCKAASGCDVHDMAAAGNWAPPAASRGSALLCSVGGARTTASREQGGSSHSWPRTQISRAGSAPCRARSGGNPRLLMQRPSPLSGCHSSQWIRRECVRRCRKKGASPPSRGEPANSPSRQTGVACDVVAVRNGLLVTSRGSALSLRRAEHAPRPVASGRRSFTLVLLDALGHAKSDLESSSCCSFGWFHAV